MDIDRKEILQTYLVESLEHLTRMEEALVDLEARPEDEEALQTIFRGAHTLKGNSSTLGFSRTAEFAHVLEDVLQRFRNRTLPVTGKYITLLLNGVDALRKMISEAVACDGTGSEEIAPAELEILKQLKEGSLAAEKSIEPAQTLSKNSRSREFGRRPEDAQAWAEQSKTLRVNIQKLDRMLNLTGEISIARGRFRQMLEEENRDREDILEAHRQTDILFMELQELIMKVRMVTVGPLFRQYIRTVRDMAQAHGKTAHLVIEGADVELDTTVIEHLKDPLTHMIRNALDHGIETPEVREAAGKDATGCITLRAMHAAGNIVIQVEDDGAGLNRRRIVEKALSKGMVSESQNLSDEGIYQIVFEPGFSTAETVTGLSGRGVGMDVVRKNIEALRGSVGIESRGGKGTTITIRLPLTLAIIEGFGVGVGEETYVAPLDSVVECLEIPADEQRQSNGRGVINLRGKPLPYLRLRELFGLGGHSPQRESIVVVGQEGQQIGLVVDMLYGESQAVIKPLGRIFHTLPGISGSTILGNGRVALILDVATLLRNVTEREAHPPPAEVRE